MKKTLWKNQLHQPELKENAVLFYHKMASIFTDLSSLHILCILMSLLQICSMIVDSLHAMAWLMDSSRCWWPAFECPKLGRRASADRDHWNDLQHFSRQMDIFSGQVHFLCFFRVMVMVDFSQVSDFRKFPYLVCENGCLFKRSEKQKRGWHLIWMLRPLRPNAYQIMSDMSDGQES